MGMGHGSGRVKQMREMRRMRKTQKMPITNYPMPNPPCPMPNITLHCKIKSKAKQRDKFFFM
ncbi:hypothetical protein FDUTEX481_01574 [Tolypothrix sp. PCC 7601]|nr:hypothetical protein FDUTEX481_01574 [Tolypothrix sp. PCC 7601]